MIDREEAAKQRILHCCDTLRSLIDDSSDELGQLLQPILDTLEDTASRTLVPRSLDRPGTWDQIFHDLVSRAAAHAARAASHAANPGQQARDDAAWFQEAATPAELMKIELLAALKSTVSRLEMIASDMRGGMFQVGLNATTPVDFLVEYEAGIRRCYERAAKVIARVGG